MFGFIFSKSQKDQEKLAKEIVKYYLKFLYYGFHNTVFSGTEIGDHNIVENTVNGRKVKIFTKRGDEDLDGFVCCKYDNGLQIDIVFKHENGWYISPPKRISKIYCCRGTYKNDLTCMLYFDEYKKYLEELLDFLDCKFRALMEKKNAEFQAFRKAL